MTMKTYPYRETEQQSIGSFYRTAQREPVRIERSNGNSLFVLEEDDIEALYFWKLKQLNTPNKTALTAEQKEKRRLLIQGIQQGENSHRAGKGMDATPAFFNDIREQARQELLASKS